MTSRAFLGCIALLLLPLSTAAAAVRKGDVDGNGGVDRRDLMLMLRIQGGSVALGSLGADQQAAADVAPPRPPGQPQGGDGVDAADTWLFLWGVGFEQDVDGDGAEDDASTPFDSDSDDDGICDVTTGGAGVGCVGSEAALDTNPLLTDSDGDGVCDGAVTAATSPGCSGSEYASGLNGADPDSDHDGLCDGPILVGSCIGSEVLLGTSPADPDTDDDSLCDGWIAPGSLRSDTFGNRCGGGELTANGTVHTDRLSADTDGDGLCDGLFVPVDRNSTGRVWDAAGDFVCEGGEDKNRNGVFEPSLGETDPLMFDDITALVDTTDHPCPNCFAVAVLPDTQTYTDMPQYGGDAHLRLIGRYLCSRRSAWREPGTGKVMPIEMVIQLGDLTEHSYSAEWARISELFDELDACPNPANPTATLAVPYLVIPGNHDPDGGDGGGYSTTFHGYDRFFAPPCVPSGGPNPKACEQQNNLHYQPTQTPPTFEPENPGAPDSPRPGWRDHYCSTPPSCGGLDTPDRTDDQWFLGNGDDVKAHSRGGLVAGGTRAGPPADEPGHHRAGVIRTPNGTRFLFVGFDLGFDFPNPSLPQYANDDLAWVTNLMDLFGPSTPTILFHHDYFLDPGDDGFGSSYGAVTWSGDTPQAWNHLLGKASDSSPPTRPQIGMTFVGHWGYGGWAKQGASLDGVERLYRDFQWTGAGGTPNGWVAMAVFDPDAPAGGQIRIRSYRVDDVDEYRTRWLVGHGLAQNIDLSHDGDFEIDRHVDRDAECPAGFPHACELTLPWLW